MDWMTRMNAAIESIEENLDGEMDWDEIANRAQCSAYHFQRVFSYMAGVTLGEYIRRRRLTLAAFALQSTDAKVIDIALRYGYDSPTSFARAFAAMHGISPSDARKEGKNLVAYPPISFQISIQGVSAMNYRIEEKEAFRIVGLHKKVSTVGEENLRAIPLFWKEAHGQGTIPKLCTQMDGEPKGVLGVCVGSWNTNNAFDYYIAVASSQPVPEGMESYEVPACTWAIFESVGSMPGAIQTLQKRIVTEWLPGSGYDFAQAPDIEVYPEGDQSTADYRCWVWVPVKKV